MNKKHSGFSIVELMVVLAIAAILATVAAPSFNSTMRNNQLATQANELVSTLQLARSEAVKRAQRVTICVSSDQATCTGANWASGWIVFNDINNDLTLNVGETLVKVQSPLAGNNTLTSAGFTSATTVQYLPTGFAAAAGAFQLQQSATCSRTINILATGRIGLVSNTTGCG